MQNFAYQIVKTLQEKGFKAYIVGGAVRDLLLGQKPKDYDIATSATPEEIEKHIKNTFPVGKAFGVMLARRGRKSVEIATFRADIGSESGRRPQSVRFTNEKEDAMRRDFTINALFYDPLTRQVIDYVGGQEDLKNHVLRFIGNPDERIYEDHLRVLRAIRIKNAYNLSYAGETLQALKKHAIAIKNIAQERVADELKKLFSLPHTRKVVGDLQEMGLLNYLLPELIRLQSVRQPRRYHTEGDVWTHTMLALDSLPPKTSYLVRLAVLLHDIGKPLTSGSKNGEITFYRHNSRGAEIARTILLRWKFSKKETETVVDLVLHHMMVFNLLQMSPRKMASWFAKPNFPRLLQVMKADIMGTLPVDLSAWNEINKRYRVWRREKVEAIKPLLTGHDVMRILGLRSGVQVGEILAATQEEYLEGRLHTKEEAEKWIKKRFK